MWRWNDLWSRSRATPSQRQCSTRFNNTSPTSRSHVSCQSLCCSSLNLHASVMHQLPHVDLYSSPQHSCCTSVCLSVTVTDYKVRQFVICTHFKRPVFTFVCIKVRFSINSLWLIVQLFILASTVTCCDHSFTAHCNACQQKALGFHWTMECIRNPLYDGTCYNSIGVYWPSERIS